MACASRFLVSISCMTYNHSGFIIDALNGFVMQQTRFPFVAVIVDDASTDGEQEVIRSYVNDYFDHSLDSDFKEWKTDDAYWTFARHKENVNCHFVVAYLKKNLYKQQEKKEMVIRDWMNSKYIALCEGDDYWIDPLKLQKRVDFMEVHEDFSACYTNSKILYEDTNELEDAIIQIWDEETAENIITNHTDFSLNKVPCSPGHTSTILYRYVKEMMNDRPEWMNQVMTGDVLLFYSLSKYGKSKFINDYTSIYRIHSQGISSKSYSKNKVYEERIFIYSHFKAYFLHKYDRKINLVIAHYYYALCKYYWKVEKNYSKAFFSLLQSFGHAPLKMYSIIQNKNLS